MKLIGLTGSIGMGKSTAALMLKRMGLPVFDADAEVHRLMASGGAAVDEVAASFPGVRRADGSIDRLALGQKVFGDRMALRQLEQILHPKVRSNQRRFIQAGQRRGETAVILDIPLLYESGGDRLCDAVIVVSAPFFLQRQRVLGRAGMTEKKFRSILAKQVPDREKRRRTPYVVETGLGKSYSLNKLRSYINIIRSTSTESPHGPTRNRPRYGNNRI